MKLFLFLLISSGLGVVAAGVAIWFVGEILCHIS